MRYYDNLVNTQSWPKARVDDIAHVDTYGEVGMSEMSSEKISLRHRKMDLKFTRSRHVHPGDDVRRVAKSNRCILRRGFIPHAQRVHRVVTSA